ncbi:MAG: VanZ family protein [Patescibacteria group bacterium]|nr:VanZ family protein [Patescibacteria group bacterium]
MFKKFIIYWLPVFIWAAIIFLLSSYPTPTTSEINWGDFVTKKTAHVVEYAILATLLYRAIRQTGYDVKKSGYVSIFIAFLYGVTDEIHQIYTPGRTPHIRDVFFDTIGACIAIYAIWNLLPKAPKKLQNLAKKLSLI